MADTPGCVSGRSPKLAKLPPQDPSYATALAPPCCYRGIPSGYTVINPASLALQLDALEFKGNPRRPGNYDCGDALADSNAREGRARP